MTPDKIPTEEELLQMLGMGPRKVPTLEQLKEASAKTLVTLRATIKDRREKNKTQVPAAAVLDCLADIVLPQLVEQSSAFGIDYLKLGGRLTPAEEAIFMKTAAATAFDKLNNEVIELVEKFLDENY